MSHDIPKPTTKKCSHCKIEKEINTENFGQHKIKGKLYFRSTCIPCRRIEESKRRENNKEKKRESDRNYYIKNKEKILARIAEKIKNDPRARLVKSIRGYIARVIHTDNTEKAHKYLGCTIKFLKEWLESQFDEKMNWSNWGTYWHIDHVVPIRFFDIDKPSELQKCFNWANMRPLERMKNYSKSKKIMVPYIIEHIESLIKYTTTIGYQTGSENSWWQRVILWYGKNPENQEMFVRFLERTIRIEGC